MLTLFEMSLVTIAEFQQPEHAIVLASALEAAGIPAVVPERHMHSYFPYLSLGFTAARVMVPEAFAEDALAIVEAGRPEQPFLPCPACGGESRKLKTRGGPLALGLGALLSWLLASWALSIPPRSVSTRICESCGHRFRLERDPITAEEAGYAKTDRPAG